MKSLMVAKYSDIRSNGWKVPADEISISHKTLKYYIKKLSDDFTSNILGTGCYTPGSMTF